MHILALAERNATAQQRVLETSKLLAGHFDIDPALASALKVVEKDATIRALKEREGVANLLDGIAIKLNLISAPVVEEEAASSLQEFSEPKIEEEAAPVFRRKGRKSQDEGLG